MADIETLIDLRCWTSGINARSLEMRSGNLLFLKAVSVAVMIFGDLVNILGKLTVYLELLPLLLAVFGGAEHFWAVRRVAFVWRSDWI